MERGPCSRFLERTCFAAFERSGTPCGSASSCSSPIHRVLARGPSGRVNPGCAFRTSARGSAAPMRWCRTTSRSSAGPGSSAPPAAGAGHWCSWTPPGWPLWGSRSPRWAERRSLCSGRWRRAYHGSLPLQRRATPSEPPPHRARAEARAQREWPARRPGDAEVRTGAHRRQRLTPTAALRTPGSPPGARRGVAAPARAASSPARSGARSTLPTGAAAG